MKKKECHSENGAAGFPLETFVIRFVFVFIHLYLAFVHFFIVAEGMQFFSDEAAGRRRRLKQEKINELFPSFKGKA